MVSAQPRGATDYNDADCAGADDFTNQNRLSLGRNHFGRGPLAGANRAVDPAAHDG